MKCNKRLKYSNYVAFSHFHGTAVNNSGLVFIICVKYDGAKLAKLMKLFTDNDAYSSDEFPITSELKSRLKSSEGGSRTMNEILEKLISDEKRESELRGEERGEKRGRKEGKIEGANEEKLRIAKDMKASGLAFDFIARFTGLTEDAVATLQN